MASGNFANTRVEKLIRQAVAHRVSADAVQRFNTIITNYGKGLAKYAVEIARHEGRKTIKENDIKMAAER